MSGADSAARERAARIADAVLAEGYALYPYRASALKNRYRWQFGVLMPPAYAQPATEPDHARVEVVAAVAPGWEVAVTLRALHVEHRQVRDRSGCAVEELDVAGRRHVTWEVGQERACELTLGEAAPRVEIQEVWPGSEETVPIRERGTAVGTVTRRREAVTVAVSAAAEPVGDGLVRVAIEVRNRTPASADAVVDRVAAVRHAPVSTHLLLDAAGGRFASASAPAPEVREAVAACRSDGLWPVLIGATTWAPTMLCAPVILDDDPVVAPESAADLFDGTEIEELLALRIATLTPAEQAAAAATDERVAAAIARYLDPGAALATHARLVPTAALASPQRAAATTLPGVPGVPEVPGVPGVPGVLRAGTRVRLRPRPGADAQDRFLAGRLATVVEVRTDFDGRRHVAVQVDDDPGASLRDGVGRHLHFSPDEVEPL